MTYKEFLKEHPKLNTLCDIGIKIFNTLWISIIAICIMILILFCIPVFVTYIIWKHDGKDYSNIFSAIEK